jgi:hypothetical protein
MSAQRLSVYTLSPSGFVQRCTSARTGIDGKASDKIAAQADGSSAEARVLGRG